MIYLIYVVYRVNLEQISALGAASIPYGGTTQVWGSARALLDASATLLLVEVRGSGRSPRRFCEQARACGQCSATFPMFESFGVLSRQNNRYPLALVGLRSKNSLDTIPRPVAVSLGIDGQDACGPYRQDGCVTRKALVPNALFLQFPGGSWQIANSAVSRSFCSWRFAQA